jgi:vacuolar protein sorting-associated protein IST1
MREAVCTLIWAASRVEIPELVEVKKQLTKKYGQDFAASAMRNVDGCVNERVMLKLSVQPPSAYLVMSYMKEIAKQYNVKWEPDESSLVDPLAPAPAPTGKTVQVSGVSGPDFAAIYAASPPPGKIPSALPNVPNAAPNASFDVNNLPTALPATSPAVPPPSGQVPPPVVDLGSNSDSIPDFDELSARFERLRRKQEGNQSFTF